MLQVTTTNRLVGTCMLVLTLLGSFCPFKSRLSHPTGGKAAGDGFPAAGAVETQQRPPSNL